MQKSPKGAAEATIAWGKAKDSQGPRKFGKNMQKDSCKRPAAQPVWPQVPRDVNPAFAVAFRQIQS